jgi:aryl-alcohol dehydrogenase-like predicted oxidoreductase
VASLGLGLAALGRPGYINVGHHADLAATGLDVEAMEQRCHEVLDTAIATGIGYVDAARSYGRAEVFLASWLASRHRPVGSPVVGSKWGYTYTAGWRVEAEHHEIKDHGLDTFRRQLDESRSLLGDHLALYQVHSATLESGVLSDDAVLAALSSLAADGVRVGITTSGSGQAATIRRALDLDGPFTSVQATWNLHERSAAGALHDAHDAGWHVIVKEALANGRLASMASVALAAALTQPWADVVLSGAATVEQLRSNVAALDLVGSADAGLDLDSHDGMVETPDAYWTTRATLPWN